MDAAALQVTVVTSDPTAPLARQASAELARAGHAVRVGDEQQVSLRGPQVLCDDASLPRALRRLVRLLPGQLSFPTAVVCVEDLARAGALLAEGFRDVATAPDAPRAVDALIAARPPLFLASLRRDIEERFVPRLTDDIRRRALEKHTLLAQCAELLRASRHLEKRIYVLARTRDRQALDDVYLLQGRIERFLETLADQRRPRVGRMPRFPALRIKGTVLAKHEPRLSRSRDEVQETLATLRDAGVFAALGKGPESELIDAGDHLHDKPIDALRAMLKIVEREVAERVVRFERVEGALDPLLALEKDCLERYGVALLPPGIALPEHLCQVLRAGLDPSPDLVLSYCLDLRDLRFKRCAEVMEAIADGAPP